MKSRLSKSIPHFPQIRFQNGEKRLWNSILKKKFINRPEERVRLELIDYFILEAGFSPHRLSFESPVNLPRDKSSSRTDIIAYDDSFKPLLLVECKSREVVPNQISAIQLARYQHQVNAPFILLSNGIFDYWYDTTGVHKSSEHLMPLDAMPAQFQPKLKVQKDFSYWKERGFAGENSNPAIRKYITENCRNLYNTEGHHVIYLNFDEYAAEYNLGNYYAILVQDSGNKLALALSSTPYGDTRLNVILNQASENRAFLTASLNLMANGEIRNTEIHSAKGVYHIDLRNETVFNFDQNIMDFQTAFQQILLQFS